MNIKKEEAKFAFIYDLKSNALLKEIYNYHDSTTLDDKFINDKNDYLDYNPIINYPNEIGIYIHQIHKITTYNYYQKECIISFFTSNGESIDFIRLYKNYLDRVYLRSLINKNHNWLLASIKIYLDNNTNKSFAHYKEGIYLHYIQPNGKKIRIDIKKRFSVQHFYNKLLDTIWLQQIINISLKLLDKLSEYNSYEDFLNQKKHEDEMSFVIQQYT